MPLILKREPNLAVKHQAFQYQSEAVEAVRERDYAAIFHEQGLGKTKIAIDLFIWWLDQKLVDSVILVAKKGLVANWLREFRTHTHFSPRLLTGDRRANSFALNSPSRLFLAHYEVFKAEKNRLKLFLKTRRVAVILDEATKIKNPEAELTKIFFELAPMFVRRVIMTGTPVANRPYDVWAQVFFLDFGKALGSDFLSFKKNLDLSNELGSDTKARSEFEKELATLHSKLAPFSVRETKASKVIELPEKVVRTIVTDWEPRQHDLYLQVQKDLRVVVIRDGIPTDDDAEAAVKRLLRLVQIAANPRLIDESYGADPGKWAVLEELVQDICAQGEKCIVWTSFTENADWLAHKLKGFGTAKVHGKLSMESRNRAVDVFLRDSDVRVLVATPASAKEGLTLTVANHVIFYDRSFSLDDYLQAQDRIHRVSQERTCYVYNMLMVDSIDEWVDLLLGSKRLAAQLAQGDITREYYDRHISYSFGEIVRQILGIKEHRKA